MNKLGLDSGAGQNDDMIIDWAAARDWPYKYMSDMPLLRWLFCSYEVNRLRGLEAPETPERHLRTVVFVAREYEEPCGDCYSCKAGGGCGDAYATKYRIMSPFEEEPALAYATCVLPHPDCLRLNGMYEIRGRLECDNGRGVIYVHEWYDLDEGDESDLVDTAESLGRDLERADAAGAITPGVWSNLTAGKGMFVRYLAAKRACVKPPEVLGV